LIYPISRKKRTSSCQTVFREDLKDKTNRKNYGGSRVAWSILRDCGSRDPSSTALFFFAKKKSVSCPKEKGVQSSIAQRQLLARTNLGYRPYINEVKYGRSKI